MGSVRTVMRNIVALCVAIVAVEKQQRVVCCSCCCATRHCELCKNTECCAAVRLWQIHVACSSKMYVGLHVNCPMLR